MINLKVNVIIIINMVTILTNVKVQLTIWEDKSITLKRKIKKKTIVLLAYKRENEGKNTWYLNTEASNHLYSSKIYLWSWKLVVLLLEIHPKFQYVKVKILICLKNKISIDFKCLIYAQQILSLGQLL